jgi:hypothetical protein
MSAVERWTERAESPVEERAAAAWRALRAEPDLDGLALARIQQRVQQAVRPRRGRMVWRWQPAAVALLVLGVAGIAAATIGAVVVTRQRVEIVPISPPEKPRRGKSRTPVIIREAPTAPQPPPVVGPPAPAPRPEPAARPTPPPPPPPAPAGDGEEVRMFSEAMRSWRTGDARAALALVEEYQDLFPGGHFSHEAIVVKVDALQALGRSPEALGFLRYLRLDRLPRSAELHVIRGELAAKAGYCEEAVVDFGQVVKRDPGGALGARALYGRASCRARLGLDAEAEADLRNYLLRYPAGAHVSEARRALAR